jgi:hypothetical protein
LVNILKKPYLFASVLLSFTLLSSCSSETEGTTEPDQKVQINLNDAPASPVTLSEVVELFVLGGNKTELQRETMSQKIIGSRVSWSFKVYEVAKDAEQYRVMSEMIGSSHPNAFGKLTVIAFLNPRNSNDEQILLKLETGKQVKVRGVVDSINFRSVVVLSPAELVD